MPLAKWQLHIFAAFLPAWSSLTHSEPLGLQGILLLIFSEDIIKSDLNTEQVLLTTVFTIPLPGAVQKRLRDPDHDTE